MVCLYRGYGIFSFVFQYFFFSYFLNSFYLIYLSICHFVSYYFFNSPFFFLLFPISIFILFCNTIYVGIYCFVTEFSAMYLFMEFMYSIIKVLIAELLLDNTLSCQPIYAFPNHDCYAAIHPLSNECFSGLFHKSSHTIR